MTTTNEDVPRAFSGHRFEEAFAPLAMEVDPDDAGAPPTRAEPREADPSVRDAPADPTDPPADPDEPLNPA